MRPIVSPDAEDLAFGREDRAFYDGFAVSLADPRYGCHYFERLRLRLVAKFLANHSGRVLEVGCGAGLFAPLLASRPDAVALDASYEMVRAARVAGAPLVVQASGDALPFRSEAFALVICSEVIEHVRDKERALRELASSVDGGGALWLTTPNPAWRTGWMALLGLLADVARRLTRWMRSSEHASYAQEYDVRIDPATVSRLLRQEGLRVNPVRYLCPLVAPRSRVGEVIARALGPLATKRTSHYYAVEAQRMV